MKYYEVEGESPEIILSQFLNQQNIPAEYVEHDVIDAGSKGLFGIGKRKAKITIKYNDEEHIKRKARIMLSEMLEKAGFDDVHISASGQDGKINLNIETSYSDLLIGKMAQTLDALQYLTDKMFKQDEESSVTIIVDVAGYRQRMVEKNVEKAISLAEQVKRTGRSVKLPPMTTMIRKEIHIALKNIPGITTVSSGEGQIKRICIISEKKG
ncbi:MAG: Jag N-terminal domain-containing protein, partial [Deferribacterales bacterium]|nr:Jag N-terminal domain-containing protein [Deferribacterales bacterium]